MKKVDLFIKSFFFPSTVLLAVLFCLCGTSYAAGNILKPLNTWAQTQATVYNSDYDNVVHVDVNYNLDSLWTGIVNDGTIKLGQYYSRERVHEVTFFWVVIYRVDSPTGYVLGEEGEGKQYIGGYYWGLFAEQDAGHPNGMTLHCSLSVPLSYGTGNYRVEVKTRLGTWDYSYYDAYLPGPQFRVDRFASPLPVPSGSIVNPDADSTIVVTIPAYSTFSGYNPSFPPSRYMIEISKDASFPWDDGVTVKNTTCYAYPEAKDEDMSVYMNAAYLNTTGIPLTLYGRIKCLGPDGQYWTLSGTQSLGTCNVTYWATRLPSVTDYSVTDLGQDTTLSITVIRPQYSDFITEAQSKSPQVKIFLVHSSVYSTYQSDPEKLMTALPANKVYTVPIDILSGAGPVTVTPTIAFTDTGTYYYCARSVAEGFTSGAFTTWGSITVSTLVTQLPNISFIVNNPVQPSPCDHIVIIDTFQESGGSVAPDGYYVEVSNSPSFDNSVNTYLVSRTVNASLYIDTTEETQRFVRLAPLSGIGQIYVRARAAKTGYISGNPTTVGPTNVQDHGRSLLNPPGMTISGVDKATVLNLTGDSGVNGEEADVYRFILETPWTGLSDPGNHPYDIPMDRWGHITFYPEFILPRADVLADEISLEHYITEVGTYQIFVRSEKYAYQSSAYVIMRFTVDSLTSPFPVVPSDKWSINNTENGAFFIVNVNPYSEFIGTAEAPDAYEIKVRNGTLTGYVYEDTAPANTSTIIYVDLRNVQDGAGNPLDILSQGGENIYFDIRCVGTGRTPGDYSGPKLVTINIVSVSPGESIQDAIASTSSGDIVYISAGTYTEDITVADKDGLTIMGRGYNNTIIKGNIAFINSDGWVQDISLHYHDAGYLTYSNTHYTDWQTTNDAGITAIDSEVNIKNCLIMPDPAIFGANNYGKGIQIWNLYESDEITPIIENNLILKADTGIFMFSQAFGGKIKGEVRYNTLDLNETGIMLRMTKEAPEMHNNIITRSGDAIHLTYGDILPERLALIKNNCFGAGSFDNVHDIWCDELGAEQLQIPNSFNNIIEDPQYRDPDAFDYFPESPNCEYKGCRLD